MHATRGRDSTCPACTEAERGGWTRHARCDGGPPGTRKGTGGQGAPRPCHFGVRSPRTDAPHGHVTRADAPTHTPARRAAAVLRARAHARTMVPDPSRRRRKSSAESHAELLSAGHAGRPAGVAPTGKITSRPPRTHPPLPARSVAACGDACTSPPPTPAPSLGDPSSPRARGPAPAPPRACKSASAQSRLPRPRAEATARRRRRAAGAAARIASRRGVQGLDRKVVARGNGCDEDEKGPLFGEDEVAGRGGAGTRTRGGASGSPFRAACTART